jgi:hypothetical protein
MLRRLEEGVRRAVAGLAVDDDGLGDVLSAGD